MKRACIAALALLVWGASSWGKEPAQVLAEKGLTKSGSTYVLAGEKELADTMRDLTAAKRKLDAEAKQRQALELQIGRVKQTIAGLEYDKKLAMDQLPTVKNNTQLNQLRAKVAEYDTHMAEGARVKADLEGQLRKLGESARAEYATKIMQAADIADKTIEAYGAMIKDADVVGAVAQTKFKLGPTTEFLANIAALKKVRGDVNSNVVPAKRLLGGVPLVEAILNGKFTRTFTCDSGAATVVLPADMADELGMVPGPGDPTVQMHMADGKVLEGRLMKLKSVTVGIFTVSEVECVIMPKNAVNAPALLGGSFLNNFIYKLNPEAEELHLTLLGNNPRVTVGNMPVAPKTPNKEPVKEPVKEPAARENPQPAVKEPNPLTPVNPPVAPDPVAKVDPKTTEPGWNPFTREPVAPPVKEPVTPEPMKEPVVKEPVKEPVVQEPVKEPGVTSSRDTKRLMTYLEGEYKRKLESPDWRQRALAVISLARLPHEQVTEKLFQLSENDKHEVVRLLAWQAIVARAPELTQKDHARLINATLALGEKGAFRGVLRIAMLDVLSTAPMNARGRTIFLKIVQETNAWETQDTPTLRALGRTLGTWRNTQLGETLANAMSDGNAAVRLDFILQYAGLGVTPGKDRMSPEIWNAGSKNRVHVSSQQLWESVSQDYLKALSKARTEWSASKPVPEAWKSLRPIFVAPPVRFEELDANESLWRSDLELGKATMQAFEVAFVVDATGSMGDVHAWLSRDIMRVMGALGAVSLEPRIGITFYRDQGEEFVTRHLALTHRGEDLAKAIASVGAVGGGDVPESVLDGLKEAVANNRWSPRADGGKAIVLIGDAPPHARDLQACVQLAAQARAKGFRIYVAKVTTAYGANDLSAFDQIAAAGEGPSVDVMFGRLAQNRFLDEKQREIPLPTIPRPEAQLVVAPAPVDVYPGEKILTQIIADVINPQYRDRLQPLVRTLLAWSQPPSPQEKRLPFPANTPSLNEGKLKPQG